MGQESRYVITERDGEMAAVTGPGLDRFRYPIPEKYEGEFLQLLNQAFEAGKEVGFDNGVATGVGW
jgi:hypothetical protein